MQRCCHTPTERGYIDFAFRGARERVTTRCGGDRGPVRLMRRCRDSRGGGAPGRTLRRHTPIPGADGRTHLALSSHDLQPGGQRKCRTVTRSSARRASIGALIPRSGRRTSISPRISGTTRRTRRASSRRDRELRAGSERLSRSVASGARRPIAIYCAHVLLGARRRPPSSRDNSRTTSSESGRPIPLPHGRPDSRRGMRPARRGKRRGRTGRVDRREES